MQPGAATEEWLLPLRDLRAGRETRDASAEGAPSQFWACPLTTTCLRAGCDMTTGQLRLPYRPHCGYILGM